MRFVWFIFLVLAIILIYKVVLQANAEVSMQTIQVTSSSFSANQPIPSAHVFTCCNGNNKSPSLAWSALPQTAQSIIIIVDDPDAPSPKNPRPNPFVHWIVYNLPATLQELTEGASISSLGGKEGTNDFGNTNYDGPCPPQGSGTHRYFFKVLALDIPALSVEAGAKKDAVLATAKGHIIGQGELIGTYEIK